MNHRECLQKILAGQTTAWAPNYELGCWGQTVQRWYDEGLPPEATYIGRIDMFDGKPYFRLDRRAFARLDIGMDPAFAYEVLEEDSRYLIARHSNGIIPEPSGGSR